MNRTFRMNNAECRTDSFCILRLVNHQSRCLRLSEDPDELPTQVRILGVAQTRAW
jgi:hypothetical protein